MLGEGFSKKDPKGRSERTERLGRRIKYLDVGGYLLDCPGQSRR